MPEQIAIAIVGVELTLQIKQVEEKSFRDLDEDELEDGGDSFLDMLQERYPDIIWAKPAFDMDFMQTEFYFGRKLPTCIDDTLHLLTSMKDWTVPEKIYVVHDNKTFRFTPKDHDMKITYLIDGT